MVRNRLPSLSMAVLLVMAFVIAGARPETARAAVHVEVCGTVSAYVKPTAVVAGALTIGGVSFVLAPGTTVDSSVAPGANLCADLTIGAGGQVTAIDTSANATSTVEICGTIQAYTKATATGTGLIKLLGRTFTIAAGTSLPAALSAGEYHCLRLTLNGFGQVKDGDIVAGATTTVKICGKVTALADATATHTGSLTIAGRHFELGLGADLPASVKVGADLCLQLTLNAFGQVSDGTVKAGANARVQVCGQVTASSAATLTNTGTLKIGGRTYTTALGSDLPASVKAGTDLCLELTLNAFGQVSDGTVKADVNATLDVCGTVSTYVAATNSTDGRLVMNGMDRTIVAGTDAAASVKAGAHIKLRVTVDAFGRISNVTVLNVGTSVSDACGDTPAPTPTPEPSGGVEPIESDSPAPSDTATPEPSGSALPLESTAPSQPTCGGGVNDLDGRKADTQGSAPFELPSTDSIAKAASLFAVTAFPTVLLMALGFIAGILAWRRRMRRHANIASIQPTVVDDTPATEGTRS